MKEDHLILIDKTIPEAMTTGDLLMLILPDNPEMTLCALRARALRVTQHTRTYA